MTERTRFILFLFIEEAFIVTMLCYGYSVYPRMTVKGEMSVIIAFVLAVAASNVAVRLVAQRVDSLDLPASAKHGMVAAAAFGTTTIAFFSCLSFVVLLGVVSSGTTNVIRLSLMAGLGVGAIGLAGLYLSSQDRFGFPIVAKPIPLALQEKGESKNEGLKEK